ncbi:tryptophanyl-tRNA synthetase [Desulfonatronum thiosulfatophilum]|uniref:Tryptophan--tRNA ligase n=1 Tax=Desulfonatronum thiosulfatophilum TaxID=617002 RepID=A0A1G6ET35_9BACT|nr:tryptophan--tRNA ligase [Desulfonatronum thiosulfatophilum]SDB60709.1 tryptophanyl-tRNA synthetase [Desulfonatronum thiosulfatophilum]
MATTQQRIVSGMRPTGPLHLGHYFGVLENWIALQDEYECFFFVADWHALTSEYATPGRIKQFVPELVLDWVAAGLDPEKCTIFLQSQIKEHAELQLLFSMFTPLGWLERNPTYKEVKGELEGAKDLNTYGFLGYPVLMAADILIYRPHLVPVGQDQLPHLELTREIARRFNFLYTPLFPEPQAKLTEAQKLPGLDGRKMSKSYGNAIHLSETMEQVTPKIMGMLTDTNRMRKKDPGNPDQCNMYPYHVLMTDAETRKEITSGCTQAALGCVDCKKMLLKSLERFLGPIQERRAALEANPKRIWELLEAGNRRAHDVAVQTLTQTRERLNLEYGELSASGN